MSISISEYRARIGLYNSGYGMRNTVKGRKQEVYSPYSRSTDDHFRRITCVLILLPLVLACKCAVFVCGSYSSYNLCLGTNSSVFNQSTAFECVVNTITIEQLRLLLSNDVESNPGPVDFDTLLKAIKESESNLTSQIKSVQSDICELKAEMLSIRTEQAAMKTDINTLKEKHEALECSLNLTDGAAEKWQGVTENMQADVDHLIGSVENQEDKLKSLKAEVEQLNKKSIANNMRVFGLALDENTSDDGLKGVVIDKVLKVACPKEQWVRDDIKSVRVFLSG